MKEEAQELLDAVLENVQVPLVLDADALNLLSKRLDESNLSQQNMRYAPSAANTAAPVISSEPAIINTRP